MKSIDNHLINLIKSKSNKNISFIEEIANVLNINYDAAYRRVSGRTQLSLQDAVALSKHYKISLNKLFAVGDNNKIVVKNTVEITNKKTLEKYFMKVADKLKYLVLNEKSMLYYSAKELPVYHILGNNFLQRFKIYIWLQILSTDGNPNRKSFENFEIPNSLSETLTLVRNSYNNIIIKEIWSHNIINTTLHQIRYFYEASLLSYKSVIIICNELKDTIKKIEDECYTGQRNNTNKTKFELYYNPLMNSNNNLLFKTPNNKTTYISYSILKYYEIDDIQVNNSMEKYLNNQIYLSKQITNAGTKDIILFFKPLYRQIDDLLKQINLLKQFPIQRF